MGRFFLQGFFLSMNFLWNAVYASPIFFAAIGDFGSDTNMEWRIADLVKGNNPKFIITTGDNNYPDGCWDTIDSAIGKYYHEYIGNYKGKYGKGAEFNRFYPSLGNHDWRAINKCPLPGNRLPYIEYFTLPGQKYYYDFVEGPVHFFVLDSDEHQPDGNYIHSVQYQWFVNKVKASTSPFKFVYFHHQPFSSGRHGPTKAMQWDFAELGIDVVMSGHEHVYERIERDGVVYIINGVGGKGLSRKKTEDPNSKVFYNKRYGYNLFWANKEILKIYFIDQDLQIVDELLIKRKSLL